MSRFDRAILLVSALALASWPTPGRAVMPPVAGGVPAEVAAASRAGVMGLPPAHARLGVSVVQTAWEIPVILVSYSDDSLVYGAADFEAALFDTSRATATGSVYDYFNWVSGGRLNVRGRVVATVHLPHDKLYYGFNSWGLNRNSTPENSAGLVQDALLACYRQVHWADFDLDRDGFVDMLWVVHAGIGGETSPDRFNNDLWSITSRLSSFWANCSAFETEEPVPGSLSQHMRLDRFSILPELSYFAPGHHSEIGVFCHEFGHALGLPDLYDTRDGGLLNSGPGNWSLMGTGVYGGDGHSPQYPTHVGAWPALFLGWTEATRPATDTTLVLAPISSGGPVLDLWFQGESSPEHFLVETRRREGFDRNLPTDGVVVYHLDEAVIGQGLQSNTVNSGLQPGLVLMEADGRSDLTTGGSRGDSGDPFPGTTGRIYLTDGPSPPSTRTFGGSPTSVGLYGITAVPGGFRMRAQVEAPGWQPAVDRTVGAFTPSSNAQGPATAAVLCPDGTGRSVAAEWRGGHLQVVLRSRIGGAWDGGIQVSNSSGDAFDPAITTLGTHDLAVVWSDTRQGAARLFYRARIGGSWTAEQSLAEDSPAAGEARTPAIGADRFGRVSVAWAAVGTGQTSIRLVRFPYLSPFGQSVALSADGTVPSNPVISVNRVGTTLVAWSDAAIWPPTLWFSRCARDSSPTPPLTLTRPSNLAQTWTSLDLGDDGSLRAIWIENGSGTSELHYQQRPPTGEFTPPDTTLEVSGSTIVNARLVRDPNFGLHVVFERVVGGATQTRYRRCHPSYGWDAGSTEITPVENWAAMQPVVLPFSPGNVLVLYRGFPDGSPHFMERVRVTDAVVTAVPTPAPAAVPGRLVLLPNPVRAGQALEIRWSRDPRTPDGPAGGTFVADVFDLAGRHLDSLPLLAQGGMLRAWLPPARTRDLPAGVYLVRPRGIPGGTQRLVVLR